MGDICRCCCALWPSPRCCCWRSGAGSLKSSVFSSKGSTVAVPDVTRVPGGIGSCSCAENVEAAAVTAARRVSRSSARRGIRPLRRGLSHLAAPADKGDDHLWRGVARSAVAGDVLAVGEVSILLEAEQRLQTHGELPREAGFVPAQVELDGGGRGGRTGTPADGVGESGRVLWGLGGCTVRGMDGGQRAERVWACLLHFVELVRSQR